jgi:pimeloyl-ACP methyl ester carboxylesterase
MVVIRRDDVVSIEYFASGNKTLKDGTPTPCITFIHGAGGNAFTWWRTTPSFVGSNSPLGGMVTPDSGQREYFTISISMRGFGGSRIDTEEAKQLEQFNAEEFARDLLLVLDNEGVEKTALVCHSFGGMYGVRTAFEYPERVTSLIMVSTTYGLQFSEHAEHELWMKFVLEQQSSPGGIGPNADQTLKEVKALLSEDYSASRLSDEMQARVAGGYKMFMQKDPEMMNLRMLLHQSNALMHKWLSNTETRQFMMDQTYKHSVKVQDFRARFTGRLHFVTAADDGAVPWEYSALMAQRTEGSLKVFDSGMGDHSLMFFAHAELNACIREKLESQ